MRVRHAIIIGLATLAAHAASFATCQDGLRSGGPSLSDTQHFLINVIGSAELYATNNGNSMSPGKKVDSVSIVDSKIEVSLHDYLIGNNGNTRESGYRTLYFDVSDLAPVVQSSPNSYGVELQCSEGRCVRDVNKKDGTVLELNGAPIPPMQNASGFIKAMNHFIDLCGGKAPLFQ